MKRDDNQPIVRPTCCAECQRFYRDTARPGWGYCEEFPAAGLIAETIVCHPNVGRRIPKEAENDR
jgi:hypothetical protein